MIFQTVSLPSQMFVESVASIACGLRYRTPDRESRARVWRL